ncbi:MAG: penicillin acylase family protein, partial [Gemmatimonadetes bacterium]|nr:penicillin acylase family protein [Gemmatimonadota bacterium]
MPRSPSRRRTLLAVAALVAAAPLSAQETFRPGLHEPDLAHRVEIRRTVHGVPHILAEDLRAAAFALAWVQLEDYGEVVPLGLVEARGDAGLVLPRDSVDVDDQARSRLAHRRAVEAFPRLDADARDVYEGFAAGVNRWLALNPDGARPGIHADFTGMDVLAQEVSVPGPGAARGVLERLRSRDRGEHGVEGTAPAHGVDRVPGGGASPRLFPEDGDPAAPPGAAGSNAWALGPSRTESGNTILLRNPHLSWTAGYYEGHVTVPGVLDFYGDFRIGGPFGIIGGFNQRLGWATTNNSPDLEEVYALEADPARPDRYRFDGAWLLVRIERVTVPFADARDSTVEMAFTHLGPVVHSEPRTLYVLRAAGDGEWRVGQQFLRMMRARSLDEWTEAMKLRARVASNFTYADADGNIGIVWNAGAPDLPHAHGGDSLAIPARRTADVWTRYVPWDELPILLNPPGGYVHNENDEFHHGNLNAVFDAGDFPPSFPEPRLRLRSQHSLDLVAGDDRLSLEEVVRRKHSYRMLLAERVKDDLVAAVRAAGPGGEVADAIDLVARWDGRAAPDSRGAVLFEAWWERYEEGAGDAPSTPESAGFSAPAERLFARPWSPDAPASTPRGLAEPERAARAFARAVEATEARWGSWDVAWGEVHRARVGDEDLPVGGCDGLLGCFRVLWFTEDDDGKLRVSHVRGPLIIAYRFTQHMNADGLLPGGSTVTWPYFCGNLFPCHSLPADGTTFTLALDGIPEGHAAVFPPSIDT